MNRSAIAIACSLALTLSPGVARAQGAEGVSVTSRWASFANPTKSGSEKLTSIAWYPNKKGTKTLATPPKAGYPVILFLHGYGGPAFAYPDLGKTLAKHGYIVIVSDTAITDPKPQRKDGTAHFAALKAATADEKSPWYGAFDMSRVGIAGHSMGGGSTAHVLANNPGYKAGFCFAPWQGGLAFETSGPKITVPVGILQGEGDRRLAWRGTGKKLFDALSPKLPGSFFYLMNTDMTHQNLARLGFRSASAADKQIFRDSMELCAAFFDKHIRGKKDRLEALLDNRNKQRRLTKVLVKTAPAKSAGRKVL